MQRWMRAFTRVRNRRRNGAVRNRGGAAANPRAMGIFGRAPSSPPPPPRPRPALSKQPPLLRGQRDITLGSTSTLPRSNSDSAHISILNFAAPVNGHVTSIELHLGGLPAAGVWLVEIYRRIAATKRFEKIASQRIAIDAQSRVVQTVTLATPLFIRKGHFVALRNPHGRLSLRYTRGAEDGGRALDVFYLERSLGSSKYTPPMILWNGRTGWRATMRSTLQKPVLAVPASRLTAAFSGLVNDERTSDVTFRVGGFSSFETGDCCSAEEHVPPVVMYGHRAILIARSEYFRTMLAQGFSEETTERGGVIDLPRVDPDAFLLLLEYCYTDGCAGLDASNAFPLLRLAAQHCQPRLLALCEAFLRQHVTVENVLSVAIEAKDHGATQLVEFCLYYASKHGVRAIDSVCPIAREEERSAAATVGGKLDARRDRSFPNWRG